MHADIQKYNAALSVGDRKIASVLVRVIDKHLSQAENKVWHAHPVWFLDGNPIVGYSKQKGCVRLMFWSGVSFKEKDLEPGTGKFKDASVRYTAVSQINKTDLKRWLGKSKRIQWDYKNIVKRRGKLVKLR
jgi:hypothetical protein